jgi:hypothetical protein
VGFAIDLRTSLSQHHTALRQHLTHLLLTGKEMMAAVTAKDPTLMARLYPKKHEARSIFQIAAQKRADAAAATTA